MLELDDNIPNSNGALSEKDRLKAKKQTIKQKWDRDLELLQSLYC